MVTLYKNSGNGLFFLEKKGDYCVAIKSQHYLSTFSQTANFHVSTYFSLNWIKQIIFFKLCCICHNTSYIFQNSMNYVKDIK